MKEELVARLNTEENLIIMPNPDEAGIYTRFGENSERYKKGSFKEVVKYCIESSKESAIDEDRTLSGEIRSLISQQDQNTPFEITIYDKRKTPKRNATNQNSTVMHLDDLVGPYIERRDLEDSGELYDYLDMVVRLNPAAGI